MEPEKVEPAIRDAMGVELEGNTVIIDEVG